MKKVRLYWWDKRSDLASGIIVVVCVLLAILSLPVMRWLIGPEYQEGAHAVPAILLLTLAYVLNTLISRREKELRHIGLID